MAQPKKRLTSTRSGHRRSHLALKPKGLRPCLKCGQYILSHRVCPNCGYYRGQLIIDVDKKEKKKSKEESEPTS